MKQISRDPFARLSIVRRSVHVHHFQTCKWCGNKGKRLQSGLYRLFEYGTDNDDRNGLVDWHKGYFCSKSCHDSYYM